MHQDKKTKSIIEIAQDIEGKVLAPFIMYLLGVPGIVCVGIWFFFFKGK